MSDRVYPRPDRGLVLAEGPRVVSEIASLMPAAPFLYQAPRGDGHPVLVMPGFGGSDGSTTILRGFLNSIGYQTEPWNLGTNRGPAMPELLSNLTRRVEEIFIASGERKVSFVGWSLGGVYARLLAHLHPLMVRQVITLGSPFAGHPSSTTVYPIVQSRIDSPPERSRNRILAGKPLPGIPSTAVFSKTDGIVPWQIATQRPSAIAENVEVYGSHTGLGFNPTVLYAAADRLANRDGEWSPLQRTGLKRLMYGPADLTSEH